MQKKEILYKTKLPVHQAAIHLENLVDSLKRGSICLQVSEEHLLLGLDENARVEFGMSATKKKGKNRISFELSWRETTRTTTSDQDMLITSQAPDRPEPAVPVAPAPQKAAAKKKGSAKSKAKSPAQTAGGRKKAKAGKSK